jgi:hypothetical protein
VLLTPAQFIEKVAQFMRVPPPAKNPHDRECCFPKRYLFRVSLRRMSSQIFFRKLGRDF